MGVDFSDATLTHTIFTGADLSGAICYGAKMGNSILRDANLPYTKFCGAFMLDAKLEGANLGKEKTLSYADFACAEIRGTILEKR